MNLRNTWVGIGTKYGGTLGVIGAETTFGVIWNMKNFNVHMPVTIENYRIGIGLGGGIGTCLLIVFNCFSPYVIDGMKVSDWGFNFSVGPKWSAVLKMWKACGFLSTIQDMRKALEKTNTLTQVISVKEFEMLKLGVNYYWQGADAVKGDGGDPQVMAFDLPVGSYGTEISLNAMTGNFRIAPQYVGLDN